MHKEFRNRIIWEYNKAVNKVFLFRKERRNPYESTMPMKLYHFTSEKLVDPEISAKILEFFDKSLTEYLIFQEERYLQRSKKFGETIKRFEMPPFIPKNTTKKKGTNRVSAKNATKKIGKAKKKIDIARSRGYSTSEILQYDHVEYPCFDEGNLTKQKKHKLLVPLEQLLDTPEYQFDKTVTAGICYC